MTVNNHHIPPFPATSKLSAWWVRDQPCILGPFLMQEVKLANEPFSPSLRRVAWNLRFSHKQRSCFDDAKTRVDFHLTCSPGNPGITMKCIQNAHPWQTPWQRLAGFTISPGVRWRETSTGNPRAIWKYHGFQVRFAQQNAVRWKNPMSSQRVIWALKRQSRYPDLPSMVMVEF